MTEIQFDRLMRDDRLIGFAQFFMEQPSIQLLHDHVIRKPFSALNGTIPWHQDYPFWPVDTPNSLSCWIPFEDVSESGGCLEVVDSSHPDTPGPSSIKIVMNDGTILNETYDWVDTVSKNIHNFVYAARKKEKYIFSDIEKYQNIAVLDCIYKSSKVNKSIEVI